MKTIKATADLPMDCFICKVISGNLVLKEHEDARWLDREQLDSVNWLPADIGLIQKIAEYLQELEMRGNDVYRRAVGADSEAGK